MACRVGEDPPAAGIGLQQPGTLGEDLCLGDIEVGHLDVEMELLRVRGVRPPRRTVIRHLLEREYQARVDMQGRKVAADRPPRIRPVDRAAKKRLVELREFRHVRAVKDHALQLAEHQAPSHETRHATRADAASQRAVCTTR